MCYQKLWVSYFFWESPLSYSLCKFKFSFLFFLSCYKLDTECPSHPVLIFQISTLLPFFNQKFLNKRLKLNDTPDIEALIPFCNDHKQKEQACRYFADDIWGELFSFIQIFFSNKAKIGSNVDKWFDGKYFIVGCLRACWRVGCRVSNSSTDRRP